MKSLWALSDVVLSARWTRGQYQTIVVVIFLHVQGTGTALNVVGSRLPTSSHSPWTVVEYNTKIKYNLFIVVCQLQSQTG